MARPLRIEHDGALYYKTTRSNARKPIYKDDEDRRYSRMFGEDVPIQQCQVRIALRNAFADCGIWRGLNRVVAYWQGSDVSVFKQVGA